MNWHKTVVKRNQRKITFKTFFIVAIDFLDYFKQPFWISFEWGDAEGKPFQKVLIIVNIEDKTDYGWTHLEACFYGHI